MDPSMLEQMTALLGSDNVIIPTSEPPRGRTTLRTPRAPHTRSLSPAARRHRLASAINKDLDGCYTVAQDQAGLPRSSFLGLAVRALMIRELPVRQPSLVFLDALTTQARGATMAISALRRLGRVHSALLRGERDIAHYHRQKDAAGEDAARRAVEICEEEIARLNVAISEL
ncbi:hypothetical protein PMZ80_004385 [Knufia obscura]|uniref:Uncharacterized protein n=2 Tax=Knufia TaxID=430999 RepID=A0AAN8EJ10_9EURO|nr:hypothetical protein PMZ80_004385 [Knufia obscura]KAK5948181.1 hypothetical protein OHC33_010834 [Knufia fluminis]